MEPSLVSNPSVNPIRNSLATDRCTCHRLQPLGLPSPGSGLRPSVLLDLVEPTSRCCCRTATVDPCGDWLQSCRWPRSLPPFRWWLSPFQGETPVLPWVKPVSRSSIGCVSSRGCSVRSTQRSSNRLFCRVTARLGAQRHMSRWTASQTTA